VINYGKTNDGKASFTFDYAVAKQKTLTKLYMTPGCRTANVVISNYVSKVTLEVDVSN
jgi:hypothetical protein